MKKFKSDIGAKLHKSGVNFRVWAPFADSVSVTGAFNEWGQSNLTSEENGYWFVNIENAVAGQEYKYVIQNGDKQLFKNDPRSLQVTTTAGNSVIVDPSFDWENDDYQSPSFNEQVLYEMHIGTFNRADPSTIGTFADATEKLEYLKDLGVNMIALMPICAMSMDRGWGYATDYIYAVESLYGGRHAFLEFVKAAHKLDIGVILDVVYNHIGPDEHLDLWQFDGWCENNKGGIYFYNDWRSSTPWGETRPDFGRPEVRQYILDNAKMWIQDCHVDGLRLDSTIYLRNVKGNNNDPANDLSDGWFIMQQITELSKKINPNTLMIAEDIAYNEFITKPTNDGGAGFSSQWEVTFPQALRGVLQAINDSDRNLDIISSALIKKYNDDAFQRIIYSDSHDSAANGSSRLSEEISPGKATDVFARRRSLLASSLVLTSPGIPMLFQGQEFMQPGSFNDWQVLDWSKSQQFEGIVLAHKHLIWLRKNEFDNTRGLTGHSIKILHQNNEDKILAYHRWDKGGPKDDVIVVLNFANQGQPSYSMNFPRDGLWRVRYNSDWSGYSKDFNNSNTEDVFVIDGKGSFALAPYSVIIFSQDE